MKYSLGFILNFSLVFCLVNFTTGNPQQGHNDDKHEVTWQSIQPILKKLGDIRKHQMEIHQQIQEMVREEAKQKTKRGIDETDWRHFYQDDEGISKLRHRKRLELLHEAHLPIKKRKEFEKQQKRREGKEKDGSFTRNKEGNTGKLQDNRQNISQSKENIPEKPRENILEEKNVAEVSNQTIVKDTKAVEHVIKEKSMEDAANEIMEETKDKETKDINKEIANEQNATEGKEQVKKEQRILEASVSKKAVLSDEFSKGSEQFTVKQQSIENRTQERGNDGQEELKMESKEQSILEEGEKSEKKAEQVSEDNDQDLRGNAEISLVSQGLQEQGNSSLQTELKLTQSNKLDGEGLELQSNVLSNSSIRKASILKEELEKKAEEKTPAIEQDRPLINHTLVSSNETVIEQDASVTTESKVALETKTDLSQKVSSDFSDLVTEANEEEMPLNLHVI